MSDGDTYDVCCCCGTERLQRTMRQVTASGLFMCGRCDELDTMDDNEEQPDDCPYCDGDGCHECDGTGRYE
jgi:hypothetical protein